MKKCIKTLRTAQKLKFSIKYFASKCDQIRGKLRTWSHLLEKSLMENFIFYAVGVANTPQSKMESFASIVNGF